MLFRVGVVHDFISRGDAETLSLNYGEGRKEDYSVAKPFVDWGIVWFECRGLGGGRAAARPYRVVLE